MPGVHLRFHGTDLFCPDCGRWLVHLNGDGTFNLAARATAKAYGGVSPEDVEVGYAEHTIIEAVCLRRSCRVKRRIKEAVSRWPRSR
jgi:hypothetical protein